MISSIDLSATILELAGIDKPKTIQGNSFVSVLRDPAAVTRNVVFAEHNWHVNFAHERMVRFGDWMYIRNSFPELQSLCMEQDRSYPAGEELWDMEDARKLNPATQRDIFLKPRPAEELYQISKDPFQMTNLAGNPEVSPHLETLRGLLDRWVEETGDSVPEDPTPDRVYLEGKKLSPQPRGTPPGQSQEATSIHHSGPILVNES